LCNHARKGIRRGHRPCEARRECVGDGVPDVPISAKHCNTAICVNPNINFLMGEFVLKMRLISKNSILIM
ncbi:MAG TPA: hypothetical protein PKX58_09660, partial [Flexilinea sp.]|nr:hypothetical protein [Flexilinea sp.]